MKRSTRLTAIGAAVAALAAGAIGWSSLAQAEAGQRHFILVGGTCDGAANYYNGIDLRGGVPHKVQYSAAGNPFQCPQLKTFDDSVAEGHRNARAELEKAYLGDPGGQFVVVGYSQGAQVANLVLNDVADGKTAVPKSQVSGSLYGDPMHPGTGIWTVIPKGTSIGGYTSPGPGRTNFGGVAVERYCIETDGICHANTIEAPGGYFVQHPCYGAKIMPETLPDGIQHGDHMRPRLGPNCT